MRPAATFTPILAVGLAAPALGRAAGTVLVP
jgi:hypothetical protein